MLVICYDMEKAVSENPTYNYIIRIVAAIILGQLITIKYGSIMLHSHSNFKPLKGAYVMFVSSLQRCEY
jgi:hypothetical protein